MKSATPKTEPPSSAQLRKAVFGGSHSTCSSSTQTTRLVLRACFTLAIAIGALSPNAALAKLWGPFVFRNDSGNNVDELVVTFKANSDVAGPVEVTMEPVGTSGTGSKLNGTMARVKWIANLAPGSMGAFSLNGSDTLAFDSGQWKAGGINKGDPITKPYADFSTLPADAPALAPLKPEVTKKRIRMNVKDLEAEKQQLLVDAFKMLHDPAKSPPRKRPGRGDPHDRYEEYILFHQQEFEAAHRGSWFPAWHRALLFNLETELRALDQKFADFTLPYWDWSNDDFPSKKKGSADNADDLLGRTGNTSNGNIVEKGPFGSEMNQWRTYNPLPVIRDQGATVLAQTTAIEMAFGKKHERGFLKRRSGTGSIKENAKRKAVIAEGDYKKFEETLEGRFPDNALHGDAHNWVGGRYKTTVPVEVLGHMGVVAVSVNDPSFWLLHSHVDEIWAEWQCKHGEAQYKPNAWGRSQENGDDMGALKNNPKEVFNYRNLGYTYVYAGEEITADKECKVPMSKLVLLDPTIDASNLARFSIEVQPGHDYRVEFTPRLGSLPWSPLQNYFFVNTNLIQVVDSSAYDLARIYRASELVGGVNGNNFVITSFAGDGGVVSPLGTFRADRGSQVSFRATPANGFAVHAWSVDGTEMQLGGRDFRFTVSANHVVSVYFDDLSAPVADLEMTMSASTNMVTVGSNLTYSVQVTNQGPATATGVVMSDFLPMGVILLGATNSQGEIEIESHGEHDAHIMVLLPTLGPGEGATLTISVMVHEAGTLVNSADASAVERDPVESNESASVATVGVFHNECHESSSISNSAAFVRGK